MSDQIDCLVIALNEALDVLLDVLQQAVGNNAGEIDSEGTSAYENAIELLLKHHRVTLLPAGRLIAKPITRRGG